MENKTIFMMMIVLTIIFFAMLNIYFFIETKDVAAKLDIIRSNETGYRKITLNSTACPDSEAGEKKALLRMKYFYTKFCPWCKKEEPILNDLVASHGNLFYIQWYDLTQCGEDARKYDVVGVPTFVFSKLGDETTYTKYGFIPQEDLTKFICDVYGGCIYSNSTSETS